MSRAYQILSLTLVSVTVLSGCQIAGACLEGNCQQYGEEASGTGLNGSNFSRTGSCSNSPVMGEWNQQGGGAGMSQMSQTNQFASTSGPVEGSLIFSGDCQVSGVIQGCQFNGTYKAVSTSQITLDLQACASAPGLGQQSMNTASPYQGEFTCGINRDRPGSFANLRIQCKSNSTGAIGLNGTYEGGADTSAVGSSSRGLGQDTSSPTDVSDVDPKSSDSEEDVNVLRARDIEANRNPLSGKSL